MKKKQILASALALCIGFTGTASAAGNNPIKVQADFSIVDAAEGSKVVMEDRSFDDPSYSVLFDTFMDWWNGLDQGFESYRGEDLESSYTTDESTVDEDNYIFSLSEYYPKDQEVIGTLYGSDYTIDDDLTVDRIVAIQHSNNRTVTDITFNGAITVEKDGKLTIEQGSGPQSTSASELTFAKPITVNGELELIGSRANGTNPYEAKYTGEKGSFLTVAEGGKATIYSYDIEQTESSDPIIVANGDVELPINDRHSLPSQIEAKGTIIEVGENGSATIGGGTFSTTSDTDAAITVAEGGKLEVSDTKLKDDDVYAPTITASGKAAAISLDKDASLSVTGGDISTAAPIEIPEGADVELTGGSITSTSEEPAVSVASGASVKLGAKIASEGEVAVALEGSAEVEMNDGTKVTVGENSEEGESYVDNNGTIVLAAGSTVEQGETTTTLPNGGTVTDTEKGVAVSPNKPTTEGISLNYSAISLRVGKTAALTATVTPEGVESTVEWSSDNEAVATVDENGVVTAVKKGTATITASVDGKSAECVVTVTKKSSSGGSSSSGSSSSSKAGDIDKNTGKNGGISISPKNPDKGDKVTVTVEPNSGYILDAIKVTDEDGKKIKLTEKDENEYTFTMPAGDVSIETTFKPLLDTPAAIPASYADVNNHWAQSAINYVTARGMMTGSNGYFTPDESLTRGMIAQILYNLEGGTGTFALPYPDVTASDWCANAVSWAAANRIMDGYGSGLFGANDAISREQLAATLYRYAQAKGYNTSASVELTAFADGHTTSEWARPAMQWAVANGLFSGKSGSVLDPQGTATRAEVASILMRFCETIAK